MKKDMEIEKPKNVELKNPKMMKEAPQDVEMKDAEKKDEDNEEKKDVDLLTLEGSQLCCLICNIFVNFKKKYVKKIVIKE